MIIKSKPNFKTPLDFDLFIEPNSIMVLPTDEEYNLKIFKFLKDKTNIYRFIFKGPDEKEFNKELIKLFNVITNTPYYLYYIYPIGLEDDFEFFSTVVQSKIIATLQSFKNVALLWDPNKLNSYKPKIKTTFWGFLDTSGNINLFNITDPIVPFKTVFAVKYIKVTAETKQEAKNVALEDFRKQGLIK